MAVHFIGFAYDKDIPRMANAVKVFGPPDFLHRLWDVRAKLEVLPGDVAVFARGSDADEPSFYPYDNDEYYSYVTNRIIEAMVSR